MPQGTVARAFCSAVGLCVVGGSLLGLVRLSNHSKPSNTDAVLDVMCVSLVVMVFFLALASFIRVRCMRPSHSAVVESLWKRSLPTDAHGPAFARADLGFVCTAPAGWAVLVSRTAAPERLASLREETQRAASAPATGGSGQSTLDAAEPGYVCRRQNEMLSVRP
jgi:hypothetical protein